jgi:hypothetical protein
MGLALDMPLAALQAMLRINVEKPFRHADPCCRTGSRGVRDRSSILALWADKTDPAFFAG